MTHEAEEKLDEFFRTFAHAQSARMLLDYDGTLAPFRVDRFEARPYAGVRELIQRILNPDGGNLKTKISIITGRPAAEIAPLLGLGTPVEVWGLHGAERLYPDGLCKLEVQAPPSTRARLDAMREQLSRDSFGGLFEDKPNAAVMHWRGISPRIATVVEQKTRALFAPLADLEGMSLLEFEAGLELRVGRNKGGAVAALMAESGCAEGAVCSVAYLGDDLTDENAFRTLKGARGPHLSALVRRERRNTVADVWLKPPGDLRQFLRRWMAATKRA